MSKQILYVPPKQCTGIQTRISRKRETSTNIMLSFWLQRDRVVRTAMCLEEFSPKPEIKECRETTSSTTPCLTEQMYLEFPAPFVLVAESRTIFKGCQSTTIHNN